MIPFLLDTLLATGALIILVLALRKAVARAFGPQLAYALWLLPLVRFVMPPIMLPASLAPTVAVTEIAAAQPEVADIVIHASAAAAPVAQASVPAAAVASTVPWAALLLAAWLGGAALFLAWRFVSYRRMRRSLLVGARPVGEVGKIRMVETPAVSAPVAFGVTDKVVALPMFFMALEDRAARDLAIAHELAHHRGRDLAANFLAQPLLALHWFNPLAWLAWRAMRRDQEAACDARVMAARGRVERARYAEVIASFAAGPRLALAAPMACPVLGEKSIIHRLRSLTMDDVSRRRRLLGRSLVAAGALALPLTGTVSYAASEAPDAVAAPGTPKTTRQSRMVIIDVENGADPDDASLHTRTITRDGRTVVLKTDRPLSDAEAQERVERAISGLPAVALAPIPPVAPIPPMPALAPVPPIPPVPPFEFDGSNRDDPEFQRKMEAWGKTMEKWGEEYGERYARQAEAFARKAEAQARVAERNAPQVVQSCRGNPTTVARHETTADGRQRILICEKVATRQAISGLRSARTTIAHDRNIDPEVRDELLQELDGEIERIESDS